MMFVCAIYRWRCPVLAFFARASDPGGAWSEVGGGPKNSARFVVRRPCEERRDRVRSCRWRAFPHSRLLWSHTAPRQVKLDFKVDTEW